MKTVSVSIVEDNPEVLETFCLAVEKSERCRLAGRYRRAQDALEGIPSDGSQVVFIDLELPDGKGSDIIRALRPRSDDLQLIVYTSFSDESHVFEAIAGGADGYLLKEDAAPAQVDEFVESVLRGESPMSGAIARRCMVQFREQRQDGRLQSLTPRELEVLEEYAKGKSVKQVAAALGMSESNVKTRSRAIYRKLNVHNRVDAVRVLRI